VKVFVEDCYADESNQAFRRLSAVAVPAMVSVPKNEEEDAQR
jgi:hypothetical protein